MVLATLGVVVTAGLMGVGAHYVLGLPWLHAFLLGSIVSSTDAAAVFFLLRVGGITIRERVRSTLEVESARQRPDGDLSHDNIDRSHRIRRDCSEAAGIRVLEEFGKQFGIGLMSGLAGGQLIILVINRLKLEAGLYPIVVLSLALCLFAATGIIGGSGFLAVFIAGIRAGNSKVHGLP